MSACSLCKKIPEKLEVETLHTPDRLPKEVEKLEVIGGVCSMYDLGQVRVCPKCWTHYLYYRDHDSESGTGYGYTDESIERVSVQQVKEAIVKNLTFFDGIIERKRAGLENPRLAAVRDLTKRRLEEDERERGRLRKYLEGLSAGNVVL